MLATSYPVIVIRKKGCKNPHHSVCCDSDRTLLRSREKAQHVLGRLPDDCKARQLFNMWENDVSFGSDESNGFRDAEVAVRVCEDG